MEPLPLALAFLPLLPESHISIVCYMTRRFRPIMPF